MDFVKKYDSLCTQHKKLVKEFDKLEQLLLQALQENRKLEA